MGLSNSSKQYLDAFYSGPLLQSLSAQQVQEAMSAAPLIEGIEVPPVAKVENRTISVNDGEIGIRIYTPTGRGPFPLFIYYHGGGWVLGDLETSDAGCRLLAEQSGRVVVSVDYRLAPQYRFPVPVEDSYSALCWANDHADELNAVATDIVVGGDSAGGNLATVMTILSEVNNGPSISAQALIYPVTNLDFTTSSYEKFAEGHGLDKDLMIWFGEYYVKNKEEFKNSYVSPLLHENVENLPPAIIIAAENDVLVDEGIQYRDKLKEAGVSVDYLQLEGSIHGYFSNMSLFADETKTTVDAIVKFLSLVPTK
ncbi:alpha/beta hydrolase [Sporosarcina sp.]|uniref:alpha/beta hydrolase n=1 Tax=Sporosarcina sp. TaxID=49982 RepID=UPI002604928D|nr:alpha/beta hydrolase [Sporosarcina sp.]